jgi:3-hydroxybutyryl-CoA dehydrogenase
MATFQRIGIVGAGHVGGKLAELCAIKGYQVLLVDAKKENLEKCVADIKANLFRKLTQGGIASPEGDSLINRIQLSMDLKALASCDLIIEAITDQEKLKTDLFREIDSLAAPETLLATHTDTVSITKLGKTLKNPAHFLGLHFIPAYDELAIVEITRAVQTAEPTLLKACQFVDSLGLKWIISHDFPGAVFNRVVFPLINDAVAALYEGLASAAEIDKAVRVGVGSSLGPLALADALGLDKVHATLLSLHKATLCPRFNPNPLLTKYVEAGYLGQKTGKGFFEYRADKEKTLQLVK